MKFYIVVALWTVSSCNAAENNSGSELGRQLCCNQIMMTSFCARDCIFKQCSDSCTYRCGFLNQVCGTLQCSDVKLLCGAFTAPSSTQTSAFIETKSLTSALREQSGRIIGRDDPDFEGNRMVFNAACTAQPFVIVIPNTPEDVSHLLKTADEYGREVSIRSGGHSYTCNSLKEGAILILMKNFDRIELVETSLSETGKAAWLGTGATWGNILKTIDSEKYSYPHGQCRSVGVGGFLLGGGVNWLGTYNKYGYGAENIIKMKAVLADGSLVTVEKDSTVYQNGRIVNHTPDNNLFFGLRGAGSSLAVVYEFLYTVHEEPETRPAIILIWIETAADLENLLQAFSKTDQYSFMVNHQISAMDFWKRPLLDPLMKAFPLAMQALRITNRKTAFPVQVMVTDMRLGAGTTTSPVPAVNYLKDNGVNVLLDNYFNYIALRPLMSAGAQGSVHYLVDRFSNYVYEEIEKEQESWQPGVWSSISLNYGSLETTSAFAQDFLNDQYVGMRRNLFLAQEVKGCSFCFWMVHFRNRQRQTKISEEFPISTRTDTQQPSSVEINLTCMFAPDQTSCPDVVNGIRTNIDSRLTGKSYSKYYNFPSCSKQGTDWRNLYWGSNVDQLMSIKNYWDSKDMFNHCQSLTNNDVSCCPFTR